MTAHYLYRVYDDTGRLIYVGATARLWRRLDAHRRGSWWAHQAVRVKAKVYRDRQSALAAERHVIDTEHPRWNLRGSWKHHGHWAEQDYTDYLTCYLNQRPQLTDYGRAHVENVQRLFRARFGHYPPNEIAS